MLHSVFLLTFMMLAAPLASHIPLAALSGILVVVAWNMVERKEFVSLMRVWPSAIVLIATLGTTLVIDLTMGIVAGCVLAALLWLLHRSTPQEGA